MLTPKNVLKKIFGFDSFRPGQEEIISEIIKGQNVLAILPTGAGKSLCYQIPALMEDKLSIVISPLISLMQDQVDALNKNQQIAAFINSSLDFSQTQKVLQNIANCKIKLLYLAPEKLNNKEFVERIKNYTPEYLFIDEAHCISEWGHNFRPSYRNIRSFADFIGVKKIAAFTATATPDVRDDIITQLKFKEPSVFVYGFERENISLNVEQTKQKQQKILELVKTQDTPTIIYTSTRKNCEKVAEYLKQNKINAEHYHAGLTNELRKLIQDDFLNNNIDVIVATNAFGMGIDKEDIGLVIHYNIPGSIENLYQEFGRAGRDGKEALTYLFFTEKDKYIHNFLIGLNNPTPEQIKLTYNAILDYHRIALNTKSETPLEITQALEKLIASKSINQIQFVAAINNLEQNNYLKLISGNNHISSFKFNVSQTQLKNYVKKLRNSDLKEFILNIIQFYGSLPFGEKVDINYHQLSNYSSTSKNKIDVYFNDLFNIGIIEFEQSSYHQKIEMLRERVITQNLNLNYKEIEEKMSHAKAKLESVIQYSFTEDCRFKFILDYFGEDTKGYKCGKCDNCLQKNNLDPISNEYIGEIIIKTFKEFNSLTQQRLIGILTGKSKSVLAKSVSTYQSCMHYSASEIEVSLNLLLRKKLLKEIGGKLFFNPVEELIDKEVLAANSSNNYESTLELFNKLREERSIAAKKFSQHPDIICSDSVLKLLAREKPTTPSQLMSVNGVNQRMFNKVGQEFLEIIKEYKTIVETENKKTDLPKHISQTYSLMKKGYSLIEISNLLKLPESIISIQLETIINYSPKEKFDKLITKEEFKIISEAIEDINEDLKQIKQKLPSNINYAKIRIVRAFLSVSQGV